MGRQSQSYCSSKLAQELYLLESNHSTQIGKMQSILSSPEKARNGEGLELQTTKASRVHECPYNWD